MVPLMLAALLAGAASIAAQDASIYIPAALLAENASPTVAILGGEGEAETTIAIAYDDPNLGTVTAVIDATAWQATQVFTTEGFTETLSVSCALGGVDAVCVEENDFAALLTTATEVQAVYTTIPLTATSLTSSTSSTSSISVAPVTTSSSSPTSAPSSSGAGSSLSSSSSTAQSVSSNVFASSANRKAVSLGALGGAFLVIFIGGAFAV